MPSQLDPDLRQEGRDAITVPPWVDLGLVRGAAAGHRRGDVAQRGCAGGHGGGGEAAVVWHVQRRLLGGTHTEANKNKRNYMAPVETKEVARGGGGGGTWERKRRGLVQTERFVVACQ